MSHRYHEEMRFIRFMNARIGAGCAFQHALSSATFPVATARSVARLTMNALPQSPDARCACASIAMCDNGREGIIWPVKSSRTPAVACDLYTHRLYDEHRTHIKMWALLVREEMASPHGLNIC